MILQVRSIAVNAFGTRQWAVAAVLSRKCVVADDAHGTRLSNLPGCTYGAATACTPLSRGACLHANASLGKQPVHDNAVAVPHWCSDYQPL